MTRAEHRRNRRSQLRRLPDDDLVCVATVYAALGIIERRPEYLYDREAVIGAIVAAEIARMAPELTVIEGYRRESA